MDKIISFPIMGNYYIPINYLCSKVTKNKVIKTPLITNKTIDTTNKIDKVIIDFFNKTLFFL